jgi:hypothetical protein
MKRVWKLASPLRRVLLIVAALGLLFDLSWLVLLLTNASLPGVSDKVFDMISLGSSVVALVLCGLWFREGLKTRNRVRR